MCITFIDLFLYVRPTCIPGIISLGLDELSLVNMLVFLGFFFCLVHNGYWSLIFLVCIVLFWFKYHGDAGFIKLVGNCFLLSFSVCCRIGIVSSFICLVEFTHKAWTFLTGRVSNYRCINSGYRAFQNFFIILSPF